MEIYLYCSYEHSQKGFFMTKIEDHALVSLESPPEIAEIFFSYDRFQVLWYDICSPQEHKLFNPGVRGSFFGIRNLCGKMQDGRTATANLIFIASKDEMAHLRRIALGVLGDYSSFQKKIISFLCVGGLSYDFDIESFNQLIESFSQMKKLVRFTNQGSKAAEMLMWMQRKQDPKTEFEILHLAVYTSNRKDIMQLMGNRKVWMLKHPNAITPEEFEKIFVSDSPLWELS